MEQTITDNICIIIIQQLDNLMYIYLEGNRKILFCFSYLQCQNGTMRLKKMEILNYIVYFIK